MNHTPNFIDIEADADLKLGPGCTQQQTDTEKNMADEERMEGGEEITKHKIPERWEIQLSKEEWRQCIPVEKHPTKLRDGWANIIYNKFKQKNPTCILRITSHRLKPPFSRKRVGSWCRIYGECKYSSDGCAKYKMAIADSPLPTDEEIIISVERIGDIKHPKNTPAKRKCQTRTVGPEIAQYLVDSFLYDKYQQNIYH